MHRSSFFALFVLIGGFMSALSGKILIEGHATVLQDGFSIVIFLGGLVMTSLACFFSFVSLFSVDETRVFARVQQTKGGRR